MTLPRHILVVLEISDTTAVGAVFLCPQHGFTRYGRAVHGSLRARRPCVRYANPHGSAHLIGVGERLTERTQVSNNEDHRNRFSCIHRVD